MPPKLICLCDLGLWPRNPKFNRGHLLVMNNHHTKLEDPWPMSSLVIDWTRFVYGPTDQNVQSNIPYPHFFKYPYSWCSNDVKMSVSMTQFLYKQHSLAKIVIVHPDNTLKNKTCFISIKIITIMKLVTKIFLCNWVLTLKCCFNITIKTTLGK